jgi:hypothetical protein
MFRRASLLAVSGAAVALALGVPGWGAIGPQGLYVTFHTDHTITVTLNDGTPVGTASGPPTVISSGQYDLYLDDSVVVEGPTFDLSGPGVKLVSDMFLGEDPSETFTETFLPDATYTWRNDEKPGTVFTFTTISSTAGSSGSSTGSAGASSGTASSGTSGKDVVGSAIAATASRGTLIGKVTSAGRLTLDRNGKGVTTLKSGRYSFAVTDATSRGGFTLQEIRKQAVILTGVAFVGKHTTTVDLKPGQWMFYSPAGKKTYFVVTS